MSSAPEDVVAALLVNAADRDQHGSMRTVCRVNPARDHIAIELGDGGERRRPQLMWIDGDMSGRYPGRLASRAASCFAASGRLKR